MQLFFLFWCLNISEISVGLEILVSELTTRVIAALVWRSGIDQNRNQPKNHTKHLRIEVEPIFLQLPWNLLILDVDRLTLFRLGRLVARTLGQTDSGPSLVSHSFSGINPCGV